jgi:hypothetical protein
MSNNASCTMWSGIDLAFSEKACSRTGGGVLELRSNKTIPATRDRHAGHPTWARTCFQTSLERISTNRRDKVFAKATRRDNREEE